MQTKANVCGEYLLTSLFHMFTWFYLAGVAGLAASDHFQRMTQKVQQENQVKTNFCKLKLKLRDCCGQCYPLSCCMLGEQIEGC